MTRAMRRALPFLALLALMLLHFMAASAAFLWSYAASSAAFEGRPMSWASRHLARPLSELLLLPTGPWLVDIGRAAPAAFYAALLLNSALWAAAIVALIRRAGRARSHGIGSVETGPR